MFSTRCRDAKRQPTTTSPSFRAVHADHVGGQSCRRRSLRRSTPMPVRCLRAAVRDVADVVVEVPGPQPSASPFGRNRSRPVGSGRARPWRRQPPLARTAATAATGRTSGTRYDARLRHAGTSGQPAAQSARLCRGYMITVMTAGKPGCHDSRIAMSSEVEGVQTVSWVEACSSVDHLLVDLAQHRSASSRSGVAARRLLQVDGTCRSFATTATAARLWQAVSSRHGRHRLRAGVDFDVADDAPARRPQGIGSAGFRTACRAGPLAGDSGIFARIARMESSFAP